MTRLLIPLLAAIYAMMGAGSVLAAVVLPSGIPPSYATGSQLYNVPSYSQQPSLAPLSVGGTTIGSEPLHVGPAGGETVLGSPAAYQALFSVQDFWAKMEAEVTGVQLNFFETVTVNISAVLGGNTIGSDTQSVDVEGGCVAPTSQLPNQLLDCNYKQKFGAFSGSQTLTLPAGTVMSDVTFTFDIAVSNQTCQGIYDDTQRGHGYIKTSCIGVQTYILDSNNTSDPTWQASLNFVPEPGSLLLLLTGTVGIFGLRRHRVC